MVTGGFASALSCNFAREERGTAFSDAFLRSDNAHDKDDRGDLDNFQRVRVSSGDDTGPITLTSSLARCTVIANRGRSRRGARTAVFTDREARELNPSEASATALVRSIYFGSTSGKVLSSSDESASQTAYGE